MTDDDIKKAKELIKKLKEAYNDYYNTSKGMPYDLDKTLVETAICLEHSIDEINRYEAKLERANKYGVEADKENEKLKAEIERLKAGVNVDLDNYASEYDSKIKAEAYKEFAGLLIDKSENGIVLIADIPDLVKEMEGESE